MHAVKNIISRLNDRLFDRVVNNRLVYNSCWEDPAIDRKLLDIGSDSRVVVLTSAGCNALAYLLDDPRRVHCVDMNPAQNALLELKCALFRRGTHPLLWQLFGRGRHPRITALYHDLLREALSPAARHFWDHHLDYFAPSAAVSSFYFRGTAGGLANIVYKRLRRKGLYSSVLNLLDARSPAEQRYYFRKIEPHLWNAFSRWLLRRSATMALLGVPAGQRQMIDRQRRGGLAGFIHQSVTEVFTERPVRGNYFWRVYLTGRYTPECRPAYLAESQYDVISQRIDRLDINTNYLTNFLSADAARYTHFILLDHQDWMAGRQPDKLREEWVEILRSAAPNATVLFRSAGAGRGFLPGFLRHHLQFDDERARTFHGRDRVGTYGSTHLGTIHTPL